MEMENDSKLKWIVYQTVCTVNHKIYVGVHKTSDPYGFDGYIGNGFCIGYTIKNPKTAYARALKKYGYKAFIRTTLHVFDTEEEAYNKEAEIVNLDFIKRRDTYNTQLGGWHNGSHYKTFYQYDLEGNFIKEWLSRQAIFDVYDPTADGGRIHRAIVNKWSTFGSYWTDEFVEKLDITNYRNGKSDYIYKFSLQGDLLATYTTAKDAADDNDTTINSINGAVNKKCTVHDCFFLKDPNSIFDVIKTKEDKVLTDNALSIYNENGDFYKCFVSRKEVAKFLGVKPIEVIKAIKLGKLLKNYYIAYGCSNTYSKKTSPGLKVGQYDLQGNLVKEWNTISECVKEHPKVRLVLKGFRKQTHGYTFKIMDEPKI